MCSQQATCRPKNTAEVHSRSFSEARSAQPYIYSGIVRGPCSSYPQGGPKAPPPPQTPRSSEAVARKLELIRLVRRIYAMDQSSMGFGWAFALCLPKDFDKDSILRQKNV